MRRLKSVAIILLMSVLLSACAMNEEDIKESEGNTIKADHWYHYKDLDIVNVQNCGVSNAYVKVAGDVMVNYYPLCKSCQEWGPLSAAVVDKNDSFIKTYYCDCGEKTTVKIKIIV